MRDFDQVPELYTDRDIGKARKRHRWMGRVEGAVGIVAFGAVWNLLGWIPSLLVVVIVGYVLWKLVSGSDKSDD
jgi:hypothetical protein